MAAGATAGGLELPAMPALSTGACFSLREDGPVVIADELGAEIVAAHGADPGLGEAGVRADFQLDRDSRRGARQYRARQWCSCHCFTKARVL
jgi:hypothetical protein